MEEVTTPHFWSALNYNFLLTILTQEIKYVRITLLHIVQVGVCFMKSISPAFSLGHISGFSQKRTVFLSSLPPISLCPFCFSLLFSLFTRFLLLVHSHTCSHTLAFSLSRALARSLPSAYVHLPSIFPFLLPSPVLLCLNFWLCNFYCIIWK